MYATQKGKRTTDKPVQMRLMTIHPFTGPSALLICPAMMGPAPSERGRVSGGARAWSSGALTDEAAHRVAQIETCKCVSRSQSRRGGDDGGEVVGHGSEERGE